MPIATSDQPVLQHLPSASQQLAASKVDVVAKTRHGDIHGGRLTNGVQAFLNVPCGADVPRWSDPMPLSDGYRYAPEPYTRGGGYCAQNRPLGEATENPFFLDIYVPSTCNLKQPSASLQVNVYIHGGALQQGNTFQNGHDQQWMTVERFQEIRINVTYRLSVLGFLGCDQPDILGNFGFKDCWLALEWIRDNIQSFGGDPNQVHLSGLSAGAHTVHQLLHRTARLSPEPALFITATLHSNALITTPPLRSSKRHQVEVLCQQLGLNPKMADILDALRQVPLDHLLAAVSGMGSLSTFRGVCEVDGFVAHDQMDYQQSGRLATGLRQAGVKWVVVGDVKDEIAFYRTQHPIEKPSEVRPNLLRYYPAVTCDALLTAFPPPGEAATIDELNDHQGLWDVPVLRYAVELPLRSSKRYPSVDHGSDLAIHHLMPGLLNAAEKKAALCFMDELRQAVQEVLNGSDSWRTRQWLVLDANGETFWAGDRRGEACQKALATLRN
ncbi:hypothetical protein EHS25_004739 [Saitozyma podzolica]|uniref:Carboxylic ester hydrolase n=1 Tax=Saitozyma podzolica TaxID=1890683 RepID=A0A427Y2T4_9TREE|nr:hypothetical protein EHS25_004739 [Saitozyma podzolica]